MQLKLPLIVILIFKGFIMKVDFIPINYSDLNDCAILTKWFNDPRINYLISPNFHPSGMKPITPEYLSLQNIQPKNERYAYFIVVDGYIIGDINIMDNPDYLAKKGLNTCWLGITIGESQYQGKGIGQIAMRFIEDLGKELGFNRMELGVFEFNTKAIAFYKKLGYQQFSVVPKFTFYNGKWYDDLRFEKFL
jgi:diamine N-acetyltransferase